MADDYAILVIERQGETPDCHIDHDSKRITYLYNGDPLELVAMAQAAAMRLVKNRQIPVLPKVD